MEDGEELPLLHVEDSIFINRPKEVVFAFVADATNDPRWRADVISAEATSDGPIAGGSTFRWVLDTPLRRSREVEVEVTGFVPPRRVQLSSRWGAMNPTITYLLEGDGTRTLLTRVVDVRCGTKLMKAAVGRLLKKRNLAYLHNLKALLEADSLHARGEARRPGR